MNYSRIKITFDRGIEKQADRIIRNFFEYVRFTLLANFRPGSIPAVKTAIINVTRIDRGPEMRILAVITATVTN